MANYTKDAVNHPCNESLFMSEFRIFAQNSISQRVNWDRSEAIAVGRFKEHLQCQAKIRPTRHCPCVNLKMRSDLRINL